MKQGDIVVVPFPFTDLTSKKLRPALIISNQKYNTHKNVVLLALSTKPGLEVFSELLNQEDLKHGKLQKKSYIRYHNILSLEKRLIVEKVATLKEKKLIQVLQRYTSYFEKD